MRGRLHKTQRVSSAPVAIYPNAFQRVDLVQSGMSRPTRIHSDKTPLRLHFIREWAEHRHMRQADLAAALEVDKASVSRWFAGQLPAERHLVALAECLGVDVEALFRHPQDDWLFKLLKERTAAERERIGAIIEAAFPAKVA